MKNNRGEMGTGWKVFLGVAFLLVALIAVLAFVPQKTVDTGRVTNPVSGVIECDARGISSVTATFSCETQETGVTCGGTHAYKTANLLSDGTYGAWSPTKTDSNLGTEAVAPKSKLQIMWLNGSADVQRYGEITEYTMGCSDATISQKVWQNGTITLKYKNDQGDEIDATVVNETAANGVKGKARPFVIEGQNDRGHPHGFCLAMQFPKGYFDEADVGITGEGVEEMGNALDFYTALNGSQQSKFFRIPAQFNTVDSNLQWTYSTDDTNNPDAVPSTAINSTLYAAGPYEDNKDGGKFKIGCEDEDGVQVVQWSVSEHITFD